MTRVNYRYFGFHNGSLIEVFT